MDLRQTSEEWTKSHFLVNDLLSELLNEIRNLGYNPSQHVSYDNVEHHLLVDEALLEQHAQLRNIFEKYLEACARRAQAVRNIQALPKLDLGFAQE
jgi:retron-type reverse transcriptase